MHSYCPVCGFEQLCTLFLAHTVFVHLWINYIHKNRMPIKKTRVFEKLPDVGETVNLITMALHVYMAKHQYGNESTHQDTHIKVHTNLQQEHLSVHLMRFLLHTELMI